MLGFAVGKSSTNGNTNRKNLDSLKLIYLLVRFTKEFSGMIHWLTINNHPSNPQQPIHSLRLARTSKVKDPAKNLWKLFPTRRFLPIPQVDFPWQIFASWSCDVLVLHQRWSSKYFVMSTPDFAKPWFMNIRGGTPPIVMIWYLFMVPSQSNSCLGFINPGLTL